jgi:hypothetical protein
MLEGMLLRLWVIAVVAFIAWLLAVLGVYSPGSWIHVLLVISISFAVTGITRCFRPSVQILHVELTSVGGMPRVVNPGAKRDLSSVSSLR